MSEYPVEYALRVIELTGQAYAGQGRAPAGEYVESADVDAYGGRGHVEFTADPSRALRFRTHVEAVGFWRQVSTVRPVRADGQPNRPLTAFTMEVVPVDPDVDWDSVEEWTDG